MNRLLFAGAVLYCLLWAGVAQADLGTLKGRVTRGPLAPVERVGIPNSAPVAAARLEITTSTGGKITTVGSDSDGEYSAQLAPGTYLVTVTWPAGAFNRPNLPATVTIKAGESTHLDIRLDTGIR
jgi:carboxypeptidase family protein